MIITIKKQSRVRNSTLRNLYKSSPNLKRGKSVDEITAQAENLLANATGARADRIRSIADRYITNIFNSRHNQRLSDMIARNGGSTARVYSVEYSRRTYMAYNKG